MKVVHIESGLGNQMLSYAELILLKKLNPDDQFYIETIIYDIPECNEVIKQWNGYELHRIFGIDTPNVQSLFKPEQWECVIDQVKKTKFWETWNYPPAIVEALNNNGLSLKNRRGTINLKRHISVKSILTNNRWGYFIKRISRPLYEKEYIQKMSSRNEMHLVTDEDIYTGQWLGLMNMDSGIELIEEELRNTFIFPAITDKKNLDIKERIENCNAVAIHARRGDAMETNGYCYKYGYFKRAVHYIKKKIPNPVFFFFTDPGSIEWCRQNEKTFGLDFKKDFVHFVDWNSGKNSFRDMQLMACCKHNIITFSSFGWWGSWFNLHKDKITCSPSVWINTTNHF